MLEKVSKKKNHSLCSSKIEVITTHISVISFAPHGEPVS